MPEQARGKSPAPQPDPSSNSSGLRPLKPPADTLTLRVAKLTDLGRARDHQEDALGAVLPSDPALLARKGSLFVIADGMGGHNAGEVASKAALAEIQHRYYNAASDDMPTSLRQAISQANQAIYQVSRADARQMGMGTTAAVAAVRNREVQVANVGDSRVYFLRGGSIGQITRDHSWVEEQVRAGVLTPEQARSHPQRNVITRALGTGPSVEPDLFTGALQEGDMLLLCSDGLTSHVADAELLEIASQNPPEQAVKRLVDLANERGGSDNISVIVVRAEPAESAGVAAAAPAPAAAAKPPATGRRRASLLLLALLAVILLAAAAVTVLLLRGGEQAGEATPAGQVAAQSPSAPAVAPPATSTPTSVGAVAAAPATATATAGPPTATLAPTLTPPPSPTATPTPRPGATATPTRPSPTATSGGNLLAVPALRSPNDGDGAEGNNEIAFAWDLSGALKENQGFEVRIWKGDSAEHPGAAEPVTQRRQSIAVGVVPVVEAGGDGIYFWTVAVVQLEPYRRIGVEAAPRRLVYQRSVGSGEQPTPTQQPATETPRPPTETPQPPSTNTPEPTPGG